MIRTYQTRNGQMLALDTDMYVTRSLDLYGEYNRSEWLMLRQIIKPGMTVVEVGANMGAHSVDMAKACAPGPFYAFEPQPRIFQILCANLAMNGVTNALAYPDACGAEEGEAIVPLVDYDQTGNFGGLSLQSSERQGLAVRVRTIDSLNLPTCGLLKVDVEGFEPQVIRGAIETIARCKPVIYIENDRHANQQELISMIAEQGYELHWHLPKLFAPDNFNGNQENVFGTIVSVNMLCLPKERANQVQGSTPIEPSNWTSPVKAKA